MASINRLTGLATGLDTESLIKNQMAAYESKVNAVIQKKDVAEIRQKLYRDILSDTRKFYNKYLDPLSKDSLLLSSAYKSVKFISSDESVVSVIGNSQAKIDNYKITGNIATAKKVELTDNIGDKDKIIINGKEFTLSGDTESERAKNLNNDLKKAGLNVQAKYTKFTQDEEVTDTKKSVLIIESTILGSEAELTVGGDIRLGTETVSSATKSVIQGITISDIKNNGNTILIGKDPVIINAIDEKEIIEEINEELNKRKIGFTATQDKSGNITFTADEDGNGTSNPNISVNGKGEFQLGKNEVKKLTIPKDSLLSTKAKITIGDKSIMLNTESTEEVKALLLDSGITVNEEDGNIIFEYDAKSEKIPKISVDSGVSPKAVSGGKDAEITITNSSGATYVHKGGDNTVTLDGVTFKFNGTLPTDEDKAIKITGKVDVTDTKDKIVNFINDYNTLITNLNTAINTKHDRDYVPLTSEQKEAMTEKEIELWEAKVQAGQLYKDSDLSRIASSLKQTMRTVMSGSGLNLEKIGIKSVGDYSGNANGTFTINEDVLTEALESDLDGVMDLFIAKPSNNDNKTGSTGTNNTGIMQQIKDTLYVEVMKSDSVLVKKVGIEGTSTFTNNTITKSISDYETKIKKMQKDLAIREQNLYSKYAALETMMNKYNSQQASLTSYLGG